MKWLDNVVPLLRSPPWSVLPILYLLFKSKYDRNRWKRTVIFARCFLFDTSCPGYETYSTFSIKHNRQTIGNNRVRNIVPGCPGYETLSISSKYYSYRVYSIKNYTVSEWNRVEIIFSHEDLLIYTVSKVCRNIGIYISCRSFDNPVFRHSLYFVETPGFKFCSHVSTTRYFDNIMNMSKYRHVETMVCRNSGMIPVLVGVNKWQFCISIPRHVVKPY